MPLAKTQRCKDIKINYIKVVKDGIFLAPWRLCEILKY